MSTDQLEMNGLLGGTGRPDPETERLAPGAMLFRGSVESTEAGNLYALVQKVLTRSPFRHMVTPGGRQMSVAMTNCGTSGWVSDLRGYRYDPLDPESGRPWPPLPPLLRQFAERAAGKAGFSGFNPDSCLINCYEPGARLSLHQDRNERDYDAPIVSLSLGLPAKFLFGGLKRSDRVRRFRLESGDVVVWGGPARLFYHGVDPLADGNHPLTGRYRLNLTFRKALL
jgi:DNA oxidative demethylase